MKGNSIRANFIFYLLQIDWQFWCRWKFYISSNFFVWKWNVNPTEMEQFAILRWQGCMDMDNTGVWCFAKPNGRTSEVPNTLPAEEAFPPTRTSNASGKVPGDGEHQPASVEQKPQLIWWRRFGSWWCHSSIEGKASPYRSSRSS